MENFMDFVLGDSEETFQEFDWETEKTTLLENIVILTQYKVLDKIIEHGNVFIGKYERKDKYENIVDIDFDFMEWPRQSVSENIFFKLKKFDYIWPKMILKYISYHPSLISTSFSLNSVVDKLDPKDFYILLQKRIPKGKYFIKNLGGKMKEVDQEIIDAVSSYFNVNKKIAKEYLKTVELNNNLEEFIDLFNKGGKVKNRKKDEHEDDSSELAF